MSHEINRRYQILEELGRGGMGTVYLVEDSVYNRQKKALKLINKEMINAACIDSFKKEFDVMSRLKHPNLVHVYDFGVDRENGSFFITMEYIGGKTLAQQITDKKRGLSTPDTLDLFVELSRALEYMHSRDVLHRDIKPANIIMLDSKPKIMDFGLADLGIQSAKRKGTVVYMAPETLRGEASLRSDLFSLGMTLFEVCCTTATLSSILPSDDISYLTQKDRFQQIQARLSGAIEDSRLRTVFESLVQFDPAQRCAGAIEIIASINSLFGTTYELETSTTKNSYVLGAGFVGRDEEFSRLTSFVDTEGGCAFHLVGEAGIGKSRLMTEIKKYCQLQERLFIESNCFESSEKAYGAIITAILECFFLCDPSLIDKHGPELKKILPHHDRLIGVRSSELSDPKVEHDIIVKSVAEFLLEFSLAAAYAIVFYIDDIQWVDDASWEIIESFIYKLHENPDARRRTRIITSSRREGSERLRRLLDLKIAAGIDLVPFDNGKVEHFIHALFGPNKVGPRLMGAIGNICQRVGGNPFFLQEFIRSLVSSGTIERLMEFWELTIPAESLDITQGIGELLLKRYRRYKFTKNQRRVLEILAVLDREISYKELCGIIDVEFDSLQKLTYYEIVREERVESELYFSMYHDLIRDVIVREIPAIIALHNEIAVKLEIMHRVDLEFYLDELAYHFYRGNNHEKAVTYLELAVQNALKKYQMVRMVSLCNQLLTLYDQDDKRKIPILLKQVEATRTFSTIESMIVASNELIRLCAIHTDIRSKAECNLLMGEMYLNLHRFVDCIECLEKSLFDFKSIGDKAGIALAMNYMGVYYTEQNDYTKAIQLHKQSLEIAETIGDSKIMAFNTGNMGIVYEYSGDYQASLNAHKRALEILVRLNNQHNISISMVNIGFIHARQGDFKTALDYMDNAILIAEKIESSMYLALYRLTKAETLIEMGRFDDAEKLNHEAAKFFRELKISRENLFRVRLNEARICIARARRDEALTILSDLLDTYTEESFVASIYGELWRVTGDRSVRLKAVSLYRKLYANTSRFEYKTRIQELTVEDDDDAQDVGRSEGVTASRLSGAATEDVVAVPSIEHLKRELDSVQNAFKHNSLNLQFQLKETNDLLNKKITDIVRRFESMNSTMEVAVPVQNEQKRIQFFQQLLGIIHDLNSNLSLGTLLEKILDASISLMEADRGFILLVNSDNVLEITASRNKNRENIHPQDSRISQTVLMRVYDSQTALFIPDLAEEQHLAQCRSIIELELRSVMCAPLGRRLFNIPLERRRYPFLTASQKVGIIYIDNKNTTPQSNFIDTNLNLFQALVDQASIAILNTILYESVNIDKLTGLYLRSYFEISFEQELSFCSSNNSHLAIMLMDIDFFKMINDRFGHPCGDDVLRKMGDLMKKTFRTTDICGRYGGDEFVMILPNTDLEQAEFVARKVMKKIAETVFQSGPLTVSIGISSFPEHAEFFQKEGTRNNLFKNASQALCHAKINGRNRHEVWTAEIMAEQSANTTAKDILTGNPIRDYRNVEMLLDVIKTISCVDDREAIMKNVIDLILHSLDADKGFILIHDDIADRFHVLVARDRKGDVDTVIHRYSGKIVDSVFCTGREVCLNIVEDDFETQSVLAMEVKSVMCVPLHDRLHRIGVMYIDSRREIKEFSTTELFFFNAIATQISLLLQLVEKV